MSLLDDESILLGIERDKTIIREWINSNYIVYGRLDISDDLIVDCSGEIVIKNININSLTNGLFKWGFVRSFFCNGCPNLISLKGAPREVKEDFFCDRCDNLKSLEGGPESCGWFDCNTCASLTDLTGAPREVEAYFICVHCDNLKSLEGAPEVVGGDFNCSDCKNLESLECAPKFISRNIYCKNCRKLKITPEDFRNYKIIY